MLLSLCSLSQVPFQEWLNGFKSHLTKLKSFLWGFKMKAPDPLQPLPSLSLHVEKSRQSLSPLLPFHFPSREAVSLKVSLISSVVNPCHTSQPYWFSSHCFFLRMCCSHGVLDTTCYWNFFLLSFWPLLLSFFFKFF